MIGITLSAEQIRKAPPEVRQWIEEEVASTLGLKPQVPAPGAPQGGQLALCGHEELAGVLSLIQGVFPAVNVLFELGRKGASVGQDSRVEAYRLSDIQHHTRLQSPEQVISCLDLINEALHRVRGVADASFYARQGDYCIVAADTQQNIRRLWLDVIGREQMAGQAPQAAPPGGGIPPQPAAATPQAPAPEADSEAVYQ